ncbi:hypothetical protein ACFS27_13520 [Promicromonospora vindobonensis]|uniref:Uncharacterized protein n=1 Tax=Promicromonospora vindobonensis TaxID=195748 RepID=A0ABW5VVK2_9MICO
MAGDDGQARGGRLEQSAAQTMDAAAGALRERRFLSGLVAGIVIGALATAVIGISTGAGSDGALEVAESRIDQLEAENSDLRAQVETGAPAAGGTGEASAQPGGLVPSGSAPTPSTEPGAPALHRVGNSPLRLEDGQCVDPDSKADDWGMKKGPGDGLLCFTSAGDNDRFIVNAPDIVNSTRFGSADEYADCEPEGEPSGFVEIEIDGYQSYEQRFCFTTGAGRTGHATVLSPKTYPDDFDTENPAYVDVLLKVWDDA